jgi:glycosyltransferase involved in cell wall biosynthesis
MVSEHASPLAVLGGVDAGGQNVYVGALARALAARGHEVDVYTRRDDPDRPEQVALAPGVRVVHVPAGPARPLRKDELAPWMSAFGAWLARAWARTPGGRRPDVVHAHFWMSGLATLRAVRALPDPPPVVQTFHALGSVKRRFQGVLDTSPAGRVDAERMLAGAVGQVVATCRDEVREIERMGAVPRDIRVVPCGVDLELFTPEGPARAAGAVDDGRFRLLSIGRLVERKGVDTLLAALAALPDCRLVVAGGGGPEDPDAARFRRRAAELGVGERVDLVGAVARADVPGLMRWADVVVAPPWYEPFGMVPLEAMACGRPVVGTAVGGLLDTILPGVTGVLVPAREPAALTAALRGLLERPGPRELMGRAARRRAEAGYGWGRVAEEIESGYRDLVHAGTPALEAR